MKEETALAPLEPIESLILRVRGQRVILDADLARIYGVTTRRLNEQVKRNSGRFPPHFMYRLIAEEKGEVVAICDRLRHTFNQWRGRQQKKAGRLLEGKILDQKPRRIAAKAVTTNC